ncbi:MAG: LEA type 2 family protein [Wenzhouxiangellaceae bacterium]
MPKRTLSFFSAIWILLALPMLSGCAGWGAGREPPRVNLQSFRMIAGEGMALPGFEFGLQVINPNPEPLRLQGVAYSIRLDGQRLIDGVSNELPVIDGYDQATVTVQAGVNMLGGIRLLERLMSAPQSSWEYEFEAKLDPEGFGWPIRIRETGRIGLDGIE